MEDRIVTEIAPLPKPATFKDTAKAILRVAAYARVSTDHEDQQSSLVAQTEYYKKLISERPGWQFVRIYVDMYNQRLIQCRPPKSAEKCLKYRLSADYASLPEALFFCAVQPAT